MPKDKYFMNFEEWERFHKNLNKAAAICSKSIEEVGNAFGRAAKILRSYKVYKAIYEVNKYIKEQEKMETINSKKIIKDSHKVK